MRKLRRERREKKDSVVRTSFAGKLPPSLRVNFCGDCIAPLATTTWPQ
jgi:hypothetical protein